MAEYSYPRIDFKMSGADRETEHLDAQCVPALPRKVV
jgi:hypothetical protein